MGSWGALVVSGGGLLLVVLVVIVVLHCLGIFNVNFNARTPLNPELIVKFPLSMA